MEYVLASDLLPFTFPVFWFSPPAILKGWVERVFLSGPLSDPGLGRKSAWLT